MIALLGYSGGQPAVWRWFEISDLLEGPRLPSLGRPLSRIGAPSFILFILFLSLLFILFLHPPFE
jgi:hypothetical protein